MDKTICNELKEYTKEEYEADMRRRLKEKGLYEAVKGILDEILDENRDLGYAHFSLMAELCGDILKLIELAESEDKE